MTVNSVPVLHNQLKGLQGMLLVIKFFVILQYKMKVKILCSYQKKAIHTPTGHHPP